MLRAASSGSRTSCAASPAQAGTGPRSPPDMVMCPSRAMLRSAGANAGRWRHACAAWRGWVCEAWRECVGRCLHETRKVSDLEGLQQRHGPCLRKPCLPVGTSGRRGRQCLCTSAAVGVCAIRSLVSAVLCRHCRAHQLSIMKASTLSNVHSTRTPVDTLLPAPQHGHAPPACSNGAVIHAFPKGGPAMFAHPAGTCARVVHVHVPCLDRSRG